MPEAFLCDYVRTPIGRYGGALAADRTDDLGALPLAALLARNPGLGAAAVEEVWMGCANQTGEDNRNVARMALLLAGLPDTVPGVTVNRLCGSGLEAVAAAVRAIRAGDRDLAIASGVESMTRAPFAVPKGAGAWSRATEIHDTTIGWRLVNPRMAKAYGTEPMPETAQNLADEHAISRENQDAFAHRSQGARRRGAGERPSRRGDRRRHRGARPRQDRGGRPGRNTPARRPSPISPA